MRDNEIITLYWNRDETAITATANTYGNYCYSIAYNILYSNEDAEECVNDTWLNAWKSIPPQRPNRLSTYLGKITRNLSFDRYKLQNAHKRGAGQVELALTELEGCIPSSIDVDHIIDEIVLADVIDSFLRTQSQLERKIFIGRYWYLYSIRDLAIAHHISESKVASLLHRMRSKLKVFLNKEGVFP